MFLDKSTLTQKWFLMSVIFLLLIFVKLQHHIRWHQNWCRSVTLTSLNVGCCPIWRFLTSDSAIIDVKCKNLLFFYKFAVFIIFPHLKNKISRTILISIKFQKQILILIILLIYKKHFSKKFLKLLKNLWNTINTSVRSKYMVTKN